MRFPRSSAESSLQNSTGLESNAALIVCQTLSLFLITKFGVEIQFQNCTGTENRRRIHMRNTLLIATLSLCAFACSARAADYDQTVAAQAQQNSFAEAAIAQSAAVAAESEAWNSEQPGAGGARRRPRQVVCAGRPVRAADGGHSDASHRYERRPLARRGSGTGRGRRMSGKSVVAAPLPGSWSGAVRFGDATARASLAGQPPPSRLRPPYGL